jgi:ATP-binding cassette subfamily B protein
MRPELGRLGAGALALLATNGFALSIPWLLKNAIDALSRSGAAARGAVVRDAVLIAVFAVLQALIRTTSRVLIFNAGRNIEYGLRRDLFRHLMRQGGAFFRKSATGDIMSRLTNDLGAVRALFGPGILNLFNTTIIYVSTLWILVARLSPSLTLYALAPYPFLILGARLSGRLMFRSSREIQEQLGLMSTSIQEDLAGVSVVKHYGLEELRHRRFLGLNDEYLARSLRLVRARGALGSLFAVLAGAGTLIVLWAGGRQVIAGRMTIGALVAFNAYVVQLSWPTIALGWIIGMWQRGIAGWARVRELLVTEPEIRDAPGAAALADVALAPSIEVRGLTVSLDDRRLLDDVSFSVPAGSTLAIVGPTGAGKTTLVDALVRLQNVAPGAVAVGGHDVTALPLARLRGLFGYAPQDPFLFSATVAENIGFGVRESLDEATLRARVVRAGEAAGLAPDVAVLPDGWDTLVGERGITLSGGQRQRVALARALASEPQILILDDTLSSVDAQTEREILTRLQPILRERTSIVVSHRVAAVKEADQILVLDGGRVAERGTHAELLGAGGLYASLYREQLAAEQLAEDAA